MAFIPLIAEGIGLAGNAQQQQNELADQNAIVEQGLTQQQGYQKQINDAINQLLGSLSKDTPAKAEGDAMASYRSALDSALPSSYKGSDANYSGEYGSSSAAQKLGEHAKAFDLAGKLSKVTGPQTMRHDEGNNIGDLGTVADMYNNFAKGAQGVTDIKLRSVHANPYLTMLFNGLQAYGGANAKLGGGASQSPGSFGGDYFSSGAGLDNNGINWNLDGGTGGFLGNYDVPSK